MSVGLFARNKILTKVGDLYNQILPSREQKNLQKAMNTDFDYGEFSAYLPYAKNVIAAYTPKGAEDIRSHPTASNDANLKLLDMVEARIAAQEALNRGNENEFMRHFDKILSMAPVNQASFNNDMAYVIAGDLAEIEDPQGPPTAMQTRALKKLCRQAFINAETMKPRGGHSLGSRALMMLAIQANKSVQAGYARHALSANSAPDYILN